MFTIKHIDNHGVEFLVQAKRFVVERRPDGFMQYLAFDEVRHDYIASWCGDNRGDSLFDQTIFVMNDKGSTVAVHSFNKPNFDANTSDEEARMSLPIAA